MKQALVKAGYDKIAQKYLAHRGELKTGKYLRDFINYVKKGGEVLDIGCGPGLYVDDVLAKQGLLVTGIDNSTEMIKLARKVCPDCAYEIRDINTLMPREYKVNGITCLYTMFHIPRDQHLRILSIFASYLSKGEALLITMGERDFEGEHQMDGETMWSSQWGPKKNLEIMERAGFEVVLNEIDKSGREKHQIILARKR